MGRRTKQPAVTAPPIVEEASYIGISGERLFLRRVVPEDAIGGVLLIHGYAEHSGRWLHVIERFAEAGYAVFSPDLRGHGRSATRLGDLRSMEVVLGDLEVVHRMVAQAVPGKPVFAFGHSMGGQIGARLVARHGDGFAGAVLNGSALQVPDDIPKFMLRIARVLARIVPALPVQPFYFPENISLDPDVWRQLDQDPLYYKGKLRAGTGDQILRSLLAAIDELPNIGLPILITAGQADKVVPPRASQLLFDGVSSTDKTLHFFPGLSHEPHNDPPKDDVIAYWLAWIAERTARA